MDASSARIETQQPTRELLMGFESLGDTCEFGLVQRRFGAEPLGLLRWATVPPADLLAAVRARFEGIGKPEQSRLGVTDDHYWILDTRYNFYFATFTSVHQENAETFYPQQCLRLKYLARALVEGITAAKTVLVYKLDDGYSDDYLIQLHDALRGYSPDVTLLGVRKQMHDHRAGSALLLRDRLVCGYVSRFSNIDLAVDEWLAICNQTTALRG